MKVRFDVDLEQRITSEDEYKDFKSSLEDLIPSGSVHSVEQGEQNLITVHIGREKNFREDEFCSCIEEQERVSRVESVDEIA